MNMSDISHLFQKNSIFQINTLPAGGKQASNQAAAPSNMLQQISNQMITRQQDGIDADAAAKAQEIRLDAYLKTDSTQSLEEMPQEILEYYMHVTKLFANSSSRQEQDLIAFKDRLHGIDQTIQGFQDVLDGKAGLPEGLETEDIVKSITEAKKVREQFLKDGIQHLNKWGDYYITSDVFDNLAEKVLGENKFAGKAASEWKIDASASDIYAEIDRVLSETHGVTEELNRGVQSIYTILEKRGLGDKYKHYLESWRAEKGSYFDQIEAKSVQQFLHDNLMRAPLQELQNSG